MKRTHLCLILALFLAGGLVAGDAPTLKDYLGRWNIKILDSGDSFFSAGLKIEEKDGKPQGELVWKWGSVGGIQKIQVTDGILSFSRGNMNFVAELSGSELKGSAGDKKFTGKRAQEMCDVPGTWVVMVVDRPDSPPGKLAFTMQQGKIAGKAIDHEGKEYPLKGIKLKGYALTCQCPMDDGHVLDLQCEIRGDRLAGSASLTGSDGQVHSIKIKGERERQWGKPVMLLQENGIDGWEYRNNGKFTWQVKDGVLENLNPPCADIITKKKFRDFKLHLEYKVGNKGKHVANSGLYLRGRYELQILGSTQVQPHGNMAIYSRKSPKINPMKTPLETEWQSLDVIFIGRWVTVILNGQVVHDNEYLDGITGGAFDPWEEKPGPFMLQGDHGKVYFRNITVTPAE